MHHKGNYGSPRIHAELQRSGEQVNHKRVERLMRDAGLVGKAGRIYRRTRPPENPCIKVRNYQYAAGLPDSINEQWAGDITYLKIKGRWQYLAVVLDLYSRKVLGWEMGPIRSALLTLIALKKALQNRTIKGDIIFHSDRGSEYGAKLYQSELQRHGIKASMNRPGKMNDNVYVESFFQTLKTEIIRGYRYENEQELRAALRWYIERYYNQERLHGSLGYCSPGEYEQSVA